MRWNPSGKALLVNVLVATGSLLLVAFAAEMALRYVLLRNLNPFQPDPQVGYRLKASFQGAYPRVRVRTDAAGHRVPADFAGQAVGRYLFVGDSVTFGFGVLAEESFPALFGELVGRVDEVANAGVPGYNLAQTVVLLRENLDRHRAELVVYGLVVNDLYDADRPLGYEDIDPHASRIRDGGLLSHSMLIAFIQRRWVRMASRFANPDPARNEAAAIADFDRELDPATVAAFDRQWGELEALARRTAVPMVVVVFPFRQQLEEPGVPQALQRFVAARCANSPLRCLDPYEMLRARPEQTLYNSGSSFHFNPQGHRIIAHWLAHKLLGYGAGERP